MWVFHCFCTALWQLTEYIGVLEKNKTYEDVILDYFLTVDGPNNNMMNNSIDNENNLIESGTELV